MSTMYSCCAVASCTKSKTSASAKAKAELVVATTTVLVFHDISKSLASSFHIDSCFAKARANKAD